MKKPILKKTKGGLTAVELLVVISISLAVFSIVVSAFLSFRDTQALNVSFEKVISVIYDARAKTLSSKNALQYGVHFQNDRVIVFEGNTYSASASGNRTEMISSLAEIYQISLNGGGQDIVFERLTGKVGQYGSVSLRLKNNVSSVKTIEINSAGVVR